MKKQNKKKLKIDDILVEKAKRDISDTNKKKKIYFSYMERVVLFSAFLIVLFLLGAVFIYKSLEFQGKENISYTEKGNIDYKVHVKENDFYENEYLDKNMSYVASLINDIKINFNYSFVADRKVDFGVNYDVVAKVIISNSTDKTNFFEKEYVISENTKIENKELNHYTINKEVTIDYDYYNTIANNFKSQYNVTTDSYLLVYLRVNKTSQNIGIKEPTSTLTLNIPLSQKAVNIKMDSDNFKKEETITIKNNNLKILKPQKMILGISLIIISLLVLIPLIRLIGKGFTKKSAYDKELAKILKEYDRFISIVKKVPNLEEYNKTDIHSFYELLDVRDSVNKVIMFYEITKHQKSFFYLIDGNELYVYTLKAVDIENSK